jgi:hypothetical protein
MKIPVPRLSTILILAACVAVALAAYEIIIPNRVASRYLQRLETSGDQLKVSFKAVDKTANLNVFNNPDTANQTNLQDLAVVNRQIADCQRQLAAFDKAADDLKHPSLTTSIGTMRKAEVQRAHAHTIVAQSKDVLKQYQQLADYLTTYYGYDKTFEAYTSAANAVSDLSTLAPQTAELSARAEQLHQISVALSSKPAPESYEPLPAAAAPMYQQAADGFTELAGGLSSGSDDRTNNGIALIEAAASTHDSSVAGLPDNLAQKAYIFQQIDELPDKIENLFS